MHAAATLMLVHESKLRGLMPGEESLERLEASA